VCASENFIRLVDCKVAGFGIDIDSPDRHPERAPVASKLRLKYSIAAAVARILNFLGSYG